MMQIGNIGFGGQGRAPGPNFGGNRRDNQLKGAEDANPLHRRINAEVVCRRKRVNPASLDTLGEALVSIDRQFVFGLKAEQKMKWLGLALTQASIGEIEPSDLYPLLSSSRFVEGVTPKVGAKLSRTLAAQLGLFSGKQQKFLSEKADISTRFGMLEVAPVKQVKATVSGKEDAMLASIRAFVRNKQTERGEREDEPVASVGVESLGPLGVAAMEIAAEGHADAELKDPAEQTVPPSKKITKEADKKRRRSSSSSPSVKRRKASKGKSSDSSSSRPSSERKRTRKNDDAKIAPKDKTKDAKRRPRSPRAKRKRQRPSSSEVKSKERRKRPTAKLSKSRASTRSRSSSDSKRRRARSKVAKSKRCRSRSKDRGTDAKAKRRKQSHSCSSNSSSSASSRCPRKTKTPTAGQKKHQTNKEKKRSGGQTKGSKHRSSSSSDS